MQSEQTTVNGRYLNESIKSGVCPCYISNSKNAAILAGLQTCQIHFERHQAKQQATHPSHIGASYK